MSTRILKYIFRIIAEHNKTWRVLAKFADKSEYRNYEEGTPHLTITFHTRGAQWWTILFLPIGLFDGYVDGTIDLEGENPIHILAILGHAAGIESKKKFSFISQNPLAWFRHKWCEWTQDNVVRSRAIANAEFHYALPVDLFKYKLGETLGYSEGYWVDGTQNINQAKHNLYEYICQKLQLKPGMKVLEVGSGWGFLPIYMVKNYDVDVIVYNPTKEQNDYMRERFKRHGVSDRIRIEFGVHGDIMKEGKGTIDRFVSIGVHEHHGMRKTMYTEWWHSISHILKEKGIGVISTSSFMDYRMTGYLTLKYIWPGGHIPSVPLEISMLHKEGLTLIEWENLWPHYYKTLMLWRDRFKQYWPQIHASNPKVFDERFKRRWTMYLEGVPETFERGLDNSHFIFVKGRDVNAYPHTLEDRYTNAKFRTGNDSVECYE
jgi:cyclopropane-fatty-acyl-phospholipid synthase